MSNICFCDIAGGHELAILIFIFSFVWPYVKTLLTLFLWVVQPSTLSVERRGSVLLWLDFLAKWSTIDIFVLIVTIVSFRVSVKRYVALIQRYKLRISDIISSSIILFLQSGCRFSSV
jgi:uncharacterized paraquat-inducible protein A